jgi:oligogalacturonide transporter
MSNRKIGLINYIAYGSNDFLGAGAMALMAAWLLYFYTTFCGLSPVEAASIFAIARVVDAIASPMMGFISDNFHHTRLGKKFGRRKFFIMLGIPMVLWYSLIWVSGMNYWYYLLTYIGFELVYSMILVPYETLAAEMSPDFKVKAKFAGARILTGQVSAIVAGFLPGWLIETLGKDSPNTFFYAGGIFSLIFVCVVSLLYTFTWERPFNEIVDDNDKRAGSLGQAFKKVFVDLGSTLRIRSFRHHLGMYLGGYISQDTFNAVFTYFVIFAIGSDAKSASHLLGVMAIVQLVAVSIFIPLCLRISAAPAYRIAVSFFALGIVGYFVLFMAMPAEIGLLLFIPTVLAGFGRGGLNYIPWNTYNYMADVDQIVTGQRREGIFAGVMTFVRKASQAGAVMLVGLLMQHAGFVSGSKTQSPEVVHTIVMLMVVATLGILIAGVFVSLRFRLTKATHSVLMSEIEHMKGGKRVPSSVANGEIVEALSGMSYSALWGNNTIGYRRQGVTE